MYDICMHVCFKYAWKVSKTWLQHKNPSNFTNNASISKIFEVLKSLVFALSLRNNVSTLFCVCTLQNLTSLKSVLNLLNKCGFFNTFRGGWRSLSSWVGRNNAIWHAAPHGKSFLPVSTCCWSKRIGIGHDLRYYSPRKQYLLKLLGLRPLTSAVSLGESSIKWGKLT